ncbi:hypothetical protein OESDEN_21487, partial [Oesophagostomum dentatum]
LFNYVKLERGLNSAFPPPPIQTWSILQQEYQSLDPLICLLLRRDFPQLDALGKFISALCDFTKANRKLCYCSIHNHQLYNHDNYHSSLKDSCSTPEK